MRFPDLAAVRGQIDSLRVARARFANGTYGEAGTRPLRTWLLLAAGAVGLAAVALFVWLFMLAPAAFPTGRVITVSDDVGTRIIAAELAAAGAIDSPLLFYAYVRVTGLDRSLASGPYVFSEPLGIIGVAHRLADGDHGIVTARITLTEGMTVADMAATLQRALPTFNTESFIALAAPSEGYLFPDTYFFLPSVTPQEVVDRLRARFDERLATISAEVEASGRTVDELVTMASILEREAQPFEDKQLVAGILWNRIDMNMRLQVDAVFGYLRGVNGYTPTAADLEVDSPYNTYRNEGFPPTPISNPGLEALHAAAVPTPTDYLYYLTGVDGRMYYGRTFDEHRENRARYLDL